MFVPGFVSVPPQVVINTTAPVTVNVAPPATVIQPPAVATPPIAPAVPVMAPSSSLFFAPPVKTVAVPPAGGQIIIIRGSSF